MEFVTIFCYSCRNDVVKFHSSRCSNCSISSSSLREHCANNEVVVFPCSDEESEEMRSKIKELAVESQKAQERFKRDLVELKRESEAQLEKLAQENIVLSEAAWCSQNAQQHAPSLNTFWLRVGHNRYRSSLIEL